MCLFNADAPVAIAVNRVCDVMPLTHTPGYFPVEHDLDALEATTLDFRVNDKTMATAAGQVSPLFVPRPNALRAVP